MKTLKTKALEPHTAIAFTERQWKRWREVARDYLVERDISLIITGLRGYLPFARVVVITFGDVEITDDEKEAVVEALKRNRSFRRLMERAGGVGQLVWEDTQGGDLVIGEDGRIRLIGKKPPVFYVLVNDKERAVEIPVYY
jgi:hypothetical protein